MKIKYNVSFNGRQSGAIGSTYQIRDNYTCESLHELKSLIYEDYEHITNLHVRQGFKGIPINCIEKANFIPVRSNKERIRKEDGSYVYTRSNTPINLKS